MSTLTHTTEALAGKYRVYVDSFIRHLQAENVSERTVQTYAEAVAQLARFCREKGMPDDPTRLSQGHVEAFVGHLLATKKPTTASNRYRSLRVFFRWLRDEGERSDDPVERIKPPRVPEQPARVLGEEEVGRILKACQGQGFEERRDTAIIRLLIDTGLRRSELTNLTVEDVDWSDSLL